MSLHHLITLYGARNQIKNTNTVNQTDPISANKEIRNVTCPLCISDLIFYTSCPTLPIFFLHRSICYRCIWLLLFNAALKREAFFIFIYFCFYLYSASNGTLTHVTLFDCFVAFVIYIETFGRSALLISGKAQVLVYEKTSLGLSK